LALFGLEEKRRHAPFGPAPFKSVEDLAVEIEEPALENAQAFKGDVPQPRSERDYPVRKNLGDEVGRAADGPLRRSRAVSQR
jgi:hypothetical protein